MNIKRYSEYFAVKKYYGTYFCVPVVLMTPPIDDNGAWFLTLNCPFERYDRFIFINLNLVFENNEEALNKIKYFDIIEDILE